MLLVCRQGSKICHATVLFLGLAFLSACGGGADENQAPVADSSIDVAAGNPPLAVAFDGSASSDPDGSIASFAWDFGEGSTASGPQPSFTYTEPGTFLARLTVTDNEGATATFDHTIVVNAPPTASFVFGVPPGTQLPKNVGFNASASSDSDGAIVQYAWNFGDSASTSVTTGPTISHSYAAGGSFTVSLMVTDDGGANGITTRTLVFVGDSAPPSVSSTSPAQATSDVDVAANLTVTFSEAIDGSTFNAANVTVTGPDGPVAAAFSAAGSIGTINPSSNLTGLARHRIRIGGVRDANGNAMTAVTEVSFHTRSDPKIWYRLSSQFRGVGQTLAIDGNHNCNLVSPDGRSDNLWQLQRLSADRYRLINNDVGDRLALDRGAAGSICKTLDRGSVVTTFGDQTWNVAPLNATSDFFRMTDGGGTRALDDLNNVAVGNFTGQFWRFTPFTTQFTTRALGQSNGGTPFVIDCNGDDEVSSATIFAATDVDAVEVFCRKDNGPESSVGTAGGDGGTAFAEKCPPATAFAGFRGVTRTGSVTDQLGSVCRVPFRAFAKGLTPLRGADNSSEPEQDNQCAPGNAVRGVSGREGGLIDQISARCTPNDMSSSSLARGGSGGSAFELRCRSGLAAFGLDGRAGNDIDQVRLVCTSQANAITLSAVAGGTGGSPLGTDQRCIQGEVMTGLGLRLSNSGAQIDQLAVRCTDLDNGSTFQNNASGAVGSTRAFETLDCPRGKFVSAVTGRAGDVVDQLQIHCSTLARGSQ